MKPKPVIVETICSECGLDWELHGENPTTSDCIRLLKAELAKPRPYVNIYPSYQPFVVPYTPTYPQPTFQPYWYISNQTTATIQTPQNVCIQATAIETTSTNA